MFRLISCDGHRLLVPVYLQHMDFQFLVEIGNFQILTKFWTISPLELWLLLLSP